VNIPIAHPSATGRPLPFRPRLEAAFGVSFAALRVRVGPLPAGFRGQAHGTHLHISPDHAGDVELLAHELTHVLQQMRRPVRTGPVTLVRDDALEAEADLIARLAVGRPEQARAAVARRFGTAAPTPERVGWGVAQPNVHVEVGGQDIKLTDADDAMRMIEAGIAGTRIVFAFLFLRQRIRPVLKDWIKSSRNIVKRYLTGRNERTVRYKSWEDLALALVGEVRSESNLEIENGLALNVVNSQYIKTQLVGYLEFVRETLNHPDFADVKAHMWAIVGGYKHEYDAWYPIGGLKHILYHPDRCEFKNLVAAAHDIVPAFKRWKGSSFGIVPDDKCKSTVLVPDGVGGYDRKELSLYRIDKPDKLAFRKGNLRSPDCTLLEQSEIIKAARDWDMPLEFGPSFTTGRVLQCCDYMCTKRGKLDGDLPAWLSALAWSLFAFWNVYYAKKYSRGHRFHEVMDMASNYGVPYNPFSYPLHGPSAGDPSPLGEVIG
jgi:hypothetical protein